VGLFAVTPCSASGGVTGGEISGACATNGSLNSGSLQSRARASFESTLLERRLLISASDEGGTHANSKDKDPTPTKDLDTGHWIGMHNTAQRTTHRTANRISESESE